MDDTEVVSLLDLPDPCVLAVLRCCSSDPRTLFSAARAHSRLHQAATAVLSTICTPLKTRQQLHSLVDYLYNHSDEVASLVVPWARALDWPLAVSELPPDLQLANLELTGLALGHEDDIDLNDDCGVLRQQSRLAKLRLHNCLWKGGQHGLHVALASLPTLQHLSIDDLIMATWDEYGCCTFDPKVLHHLPRLTYLEISRMNIGWDCDPPGPLAAVQLTELQALHV